MLTADPETPFQHFLRLYRNCISDSPEETAQSLELIRRGFRFLASTSAGKVIQHIYFGIDLCIELGGHLYLIKDGAEYAGFAIRGDGLSLMSKNRLRHSYPQDEVVTALASLSTHATAVKEIYEAVVEVGRLDGGMDTITLDECQQNPRKLRELIQSRAAKELSMTRELIASKVSELRYRQTYWDITPKNILRFLQMMSQNASMMSEPMYLHIDVLTNKSSEILEYLSVFGAQAPSFYYGNSIKQIANTGTDDPNLRLVNGKRAVPHLPFVRKGLIAAAGDWATVRRTHAVKFQGPKKAGPNAGFSDTKNRDGIMASPEFDDFYPLLRLWSYSMSNDSQGGSSGKGKKRASAEVDDAMEGGSSSKKQKPVFNFL